MTDQETKPGRVLEGVQIDHAARVERCKVCGAAIWFGRTKAGRPCPFDIVDGEHSAVTHFSTCPNVRVFTGGREPVPAGDAGLERQPVDTAAIRQRLAEVGQLMQEYGETIHVDGEVSLAQAVLHLAKSVPTLLAEIDRLRAQLVIQQAVVDAAREFVDNDPCRYDHNDYCQTHYGQRPCHMERLRAALEVQAAQPEGERG